MNSDRTLLSLFITTSVLLSGCPAPPTNVEPPAEREDAIDSSQSSTRPESEAAEEPSKPEPAVPSSTNATSTTENSRRASATDPTENVGRPGATHSGEPVYGRPVAAGSASPQEAIATAEQKLAEAERAAQSGQYTDAYHAALAGWKPLQPHCSDATCSRLSEELLVRMERYGEEISGDLPSEAVDARLKIR